MNKIREFLIRILTGNETMDLDDVKIPSFKIGKGLYIATSLVVPLGICLLASKFMDINSREFTIVLLTLLINIGIVLCWILYNLMKTIKFSFKEKVGLACIPFVVIVLCVIYFDFI